MKGLILAAGKGMRLERTEPGPKALLNFRGKRLIDYLLTAFDSCFIEKDNIWIVTGFENQYLEEVGTNFVFNPLFESTNMLASVHSARHIFDGTSDLILSYSDIIFETKILKQLIDSCGDLVLISDTKWENLWKFRMDDYLNDVESFSKNEKNQLLEIGGKYIDRENIAGQYIGLIKISANFQQVFIREVESCYSDSPRNIALSKNAKMSMTEFLQLLITKGYNINVSEISNGWLEFDSRSDFIKYSESDISNICNLENIR